MLSRYPLHSVGLIIAGIILRHKYKISADDKFSKEVYRFPTRSFNNWGMQRGEAL